jgi:dihydrofolate synthase / folylpolyglutamate synthase
MNYQEALKYLYSLEKFGIRLGLGRVKKILKLLGNPQDELRMIHIAGTNGKGSTAVFTASILEEAGYRVGIYVSPHLANFRERIRINEKMISAREMAGLFSLIRLVAPDHGLTYFEFTTIAAFLYFQRNKVDFAVIEVGLGGRLDATNAIKKSLVSVITSIDFDHVQYLGKTTQKIAFEKAGIIKKKGTVIDGSNHKKTIEVIKNIALKKKAGLWQVGRDLKALRYKVENNYQSFDYRGPGIKLDKLEIKMRGQHQVHNALCALGAIEVLIRQGWPIAEQAIRGGLKNAVWPGRLELFKVYNNNGERVNVLLDGAHNPAGIKSLKNYLKSAIITFNRLHLVFGVLADKDIKGMLEALPLADTLIITKPKSERVALPQEVAEQALGCQPVILTNNVKTAIDKAMSLSGKKDLICITGSLYTVGEARETIIKFRGAN